MKILCICGARPNFMKVAPIMRAFAAYPDVEAKLIHTGQHYDEKMSKLFFDELGMPEPDINLEVGSGSHAQQTATIMSRFEPVVLDEKPDWVLVVGDVNSTVACALVASKLGVKVAHVEAGLRSFDRSMPEEINRIVTDGLSDLLLVSEPSGLENLAREGVPSDKVEFVGNVMIDSLLTHRDRSRESNVLADLDLAPKGYSVVTLHRPSNVDDDTNLRTLIETLAGLDAKRPVVFVCHPRTRQRIGDWQLPANLRLLPPLGYLDFMALVDNSYAVLTDSGGIQEETTVLGVPCLTLRPNTERPVTITEGTNQLVGTAPEAIRAAWAKLADWTMPKKHPQLWDGKASERIAQRLTGHRPGAASGSPQRPARSRS